MDLFPLHCERSGCISRFHALMEEEKQEAAFYIPMETPHAEAAKNRSCFIQPSGKVFRQNLAIAVQRGNAFSILSAGRERF